eukprot:COSAG03_NODE_1253_length_4469_cov_4.639130_4_plen_78_part_00
MCVCVHPAKLLQAVAELGDVIVPTQGAFRFACARHRNRRRDRHRDTDTDTETEREIKRDQERPRETKRAVQSRANSV